MAVAGGGPPKLPPGPYTTSLDAYGSRQPGPCSIVGPNGRVGSRLICRSGGGLDRQGAQVAAWAAHEGLAVGRIVTEIGSALNGRRQGLLALLRDPSMTTIVVERQDRLARFSASPWRPRWQPRADG